MKKIFLTLLLWGILTNLYSQPYRLAAGFTTDITASNYAGTGLSAKFFFSRKSAAEASFLKDGLNYHLNIMYQYHMGIDKDKTLYGYVGIGAYDILFPRGVIGLEFSPKKIPLSIAADWRPFYIWAADDDADVTGLQHFGFSIRYAFK